MMAGDGTAIDFRKLILEERKRAKQRQQAQKTESDAAVSEPDAKTRIPPEQDQLSSSEQDELTFDWTLPKPHPVLDPSQHCVSESRPRSIYYISRFLNDDYAKQLTEWLQGLPNASQHDCPNGRWNTMRYAKRRVALFDGTPADRDLPAPLQVLAETLVSCGVFDGRHKPNHVLVNEYTETQGILPHTDGPLYYDRTATISIGGGDVLLKFTPRLSSDQIRGDVDRDSVKEVWLEGCGSLVVFCNEAYTNHCHGIDDKVVVEHASDKCVNALAGTPIQRGYRISLTFRHKL